LIRDNISSNTTHWILWVFLGINLLGLMFYINYFYENQYLPSPFVHDKTNTFMDFFNTMQWAYDEGRYSEWRSVYPPLVFIFLKFINIVFLGGPPADAEAIRQNSPLLITFLIIIYLLIPISVMRTNIWKDILLKNKIILFFIIIFSSPMLFALERGNIILIAPILISLMISNAGFLRSFSIAVLINIKPYFALLLLFYLTQKDWKGLIYCTAVSGLLFLITGLVLDENFHLFFLNLLNFSQQESLFSPREVLALPSSVSVFSYVLKNPDVFRFAGQFLSFNLIEDIVLCIDFFKIFLIGFVLLFLLLKGNKFKSAEIFSLLILLITNLGVSVGGYTLIFYICLIPIILEMKFFKIIFIILFVLSSPLDVISLMHNSLGFQEVYLSGDRVNIDWNLGLGSFVRPVFNMVFLIIIAMEVYFKYEKN
jgi:hypothetical protein